MANVRLILNDASVSTDVEDRTTLADFVRNQHHLTGTHLGCEHGVCGACTILLDGVPVRSCIAYVPSLEGRNVRTIEGFAGDVVMQALRKAFNEEHALQCGYCTPGMLVTAYDIVTRFADAEEERIRTELAGNLCRCTGYQGIVNAIARVIRELPTEQRLRGPAARKAAPATFGRLRRFTPAAEDQRHSIPQSSVEVAALPNGWSRISDSFVIPKKPEDVWAAFANLPDVTQCMPGASFSEVSGNDVKGALRVGFGPIKAEFACSGTVERDDANRRGTLKGSGGDARRGSQAQGKVTYQVLPDNAGSRVAVTVDYQLRGPLAQFSRSGLIKDLMRMMMSEFARNLSASLAGQSQTASPARQLNVTALVWKAVQGRLASIFRRSGDLKR